MKAIQITAALYVAIGIVTFGHAAAAADKQARAEYTECLRNPPKDRLCYRGDIPAANGIVAATLWPLYWSWEAWK